MPDTSGPEQTLKPADESRMFMEDRGQEPFLKISTAEFMTTLESSLSVNSHHTQCTALSRDISIFRVPYGRLCQWS